MGTGKATVTLSMDWKGTPVASTTHTLFVSDPTGGPALAVSSRLIRSLPHADRAAVVPDVRFTPKGTLFTAGFPSGVVQLWDPATGKELCRIDSPRVSRSSVDYALPSADFGTLFVPIDGRKVIRIEDDPKRTTRIEYDGKILVWDLASGEPKATLKAQPGHGVLSVDVSHDGSRLISTERPGGPENSSLLPDVVRMTDAATGRSWKLAEGYGTAAFSPDGKRAYVSVTNARKKEGALLVFDREGKEQAPLVRKGKEMLHPPTLSPDGRRLAVNVGAWRINQPGTLKVFDLATGESVAEFASGGDFPFVRPTFSPDGSLVAAGDHNDQLRVFDVAKRAVVLQHKPKGWRLGQSVAFSKDGRRLAVPMQAKADGAEANDPDPIDLPLPRIYLFDLTKPKSAPEVIVCPQGWAGGVAFSADGKTLAFGSTGAVHLFDVSGPLK